MSSSATPNTSEDAQLPPQTVPASVEMGWLIIALLIPLWVNFWADQPFELSKVMLFRALVWLLTGGWMVLWLAGRSHPWRDLRDNALLVPVGLLAAAIATATVFAVNPLLSLFGTMERGQGALTLLSYLLLFLIVTSQMHTRAQAHRLLSAMVATAGVIVPLSLLQTAGWNPIGLVSDARAPIIATLGRANFVGAYLAMLAPLTLALTLMAEQGWRRSLLALLFTGELTVIALTLVRGAWLAAGTGLAVYGLLRLWPSLDRRGRRLLTVSSALVGAVALMFLGWLLLRAQTGSIAARRTIWMAVGQLIADRPLTGYGPDALAMVFPRVYPPQLVYYQGRHVFVDRAHNLLLDWAVTVGLLGVVASVTVLVSFFALGLRRLTDAMQRIEHDPSPLNARGMVLTACIAAVAGNLAGTMVSFDVTATAATTWLLIALVGSPAMAQGAAEREPPTALPHPRTSQGLRRIVGGLLLLGSVAATVQLNGRPLLASIAHRTAVLRTEAGNTVGAVSAAQRAVRLWPWEPQHQWLLGQVTWRAAQQDDGDLAAWRRAEATLLTARDLRPEDYTGWVHLGDFYATVGTQIDPTAFALAHQVYAQAASLAPNHARLYVAWGQVFLEEGRLDPALARFQQAVDLDATDGLAFRLIGDVKLAQGQPEMALEAYQEAVHWSPDTALAHLGLARTYAALGHPDAAQAALARALALDPHHPGVYALHQQLDATP